jgi:hypothetical protein
VGDLGDDLVGGLDLVGDALQRLACLADQTDAMVDLAGGAGDLILDLLGRNSRALGKLADFLSDDRKTLAGFAGAGCLDAGIQRQQIGLEGDLVDDADDLGNFRRRLLDAAYNCTSKQECTPAAHRGCIRPPVVEPQAIETLIRQGQGTFLETQLKLGNVNRCWLFRHTCRNRPGVAANDGRGGCIHVDAVYRRRWRRGRNHGFRRRLADEDDGRAAHPAFGAIDLLFAADVADFTCLESAGLQLRHRIVFLGQFGLERRAIGTAFGDDAAFSARRNLADHFYRGRHHRACHQQDCRTEENLTHQCHSVSSWERYSAALFPSRQGKG